ncbi:uncharacterized protein AMSG_12329 [Thecamonas trahens ATCC 50062]|uniref:EF-hand domain-containing protein n=1 Tax=Thecamonas trahens ATCC 50062 TaxID=461836 RepID=A0A0L0DSD9_THETB|nr:hypothetical protein AMSG_12329 [Thecamonas trahens ATCC 50062]KNC54951.1 hypothetical protein AMSG_12329 [Thecamonas trahens ATCC 50062]|eukprot:XP_013753452.1 hypothetical protein AMSG_12329 [Thecamonas trahens ATCC 50062]
MASTSKLSKTKTKEVIDALRQGLQLVIAAPTVATVMTDGTALALDAVMLDGRLPHRIRFLAGWILRAAGENQGLYNSSARVIGSPGQTIAEFVPLLDLSPAGKSLTRACSLIAYATVAIEGVVDGNEAAALHAVFDEALASVLARGYTQPAVERKRESVWGFGSSSSGSGSGGPVEVTELDGSRALGPATILSITGKYSHEQLFAALAFSLVRELLSANASVHSPALRDALLGYCMRLLAQAEKTESASLFDSLANASGFTLSRTKAHPIDEASLQAATVDVVRLLDTLAAQDPDVIPDVFPIVQRLYARNLKRPDGFVFLALLRFFLHHSAAVGYDTDPVFAAFFQGFLGNHVDDTLLTTATLGFCLGAADELAASTGVFKHYYPVLLQAIAFAPHTLAADALALLPRIASSASAVELLHSLLDLPLMSATMETRRAGGAAAAVYRVLYNYVLRTEAGVSINFWESTTTAELMSSFCAEIRMSPRIHAAAQLAPALLTAFFDVVLALPHLDSSLATTLFTHALARFEQLFLLDLYTVAVRGVLVEYVLALISRFPILVATARDDIVAVLAGGATPGTLELHTALTWAVGQYAAPETSPSFTSEVLDDLHSTLQVMVFEHIASAAQGRDVLAALGFEPDVLNRLMYILISALAKLAARYQTLTPSVTLCLTKLISKADLFDPYVISAASQHIRLLQFPGMAAALLAAPTQPGYVDDNSSLAFVLQAHTSMLGSREAFGETMSRVLSNGKAQPSPTLSKEKRARFREAFARMDHDGSGQLNANDISELLSRLGYEVTREEVLGYIGEVDEDGDGEISFPEFVDMLTLHKNAVLAGVVDDLILSDEQIRELEDVFNLFDADRDGTISASELEKVLRDLGQEVDHDELVEMIAEVDEDGNGVIDFDEFCLMMSRRMKDSDLQSNIASVFSLFDPDETGAATPDAIVSVFASVGETITRADAVRLLRAADADHDGYVTLDDLLDVMGITRSGSSASLHTMSALNLSSFLSSSQSLASLARDG